MKKIYLILSLLLGFFITNSVYAQQGATMIGLSYSMGFTSGDTNDFISDGSYRGFEFSYRKFLKDNVSVGITSGYNNFYQDKGYQSSTYRDNVTISGNTYNYLHAVPILVTGHFYFGQEGGPRPYAGLGIGTFYIERKNEVGSLLTSDGNWYFGLSPEIGAIMPIGSSGLNLLANGKYNYAVDEAYWGVNVGIVFGM